MGVVIEHIKNCVTYFFLGLVCGAVCVYYASSRDHRRDITTAGITTTTVSGDPQRVDKVHTGGGVLSITTTADGPGTATTTIPLVVIPPARDWLLKRHNVLVKGYYLWTPDGFFPGFGVDYFYRYDRYFIGGGILFAQKYAGASVGAGVAF